jgi:integrase
MAARKLLTQLAIEKAKPRPERYDLPDGPGGVPGLALRVTPDGVRTFALRYRLAGQQRRLTIGRYPAMGLGEARTAARAGLEMAMRGEDPAATKAEAKREREANTVAAVVALYVDRNLKRNTRRWQDAEAMLRRDVVSVWAARPLASITRRDVIALVDAIADRGSPVTANRVLSKIKALFAWAMARDLVQVSPAALVAPPTKETPRERTIDEAELRAIWPALEAMGYPFGTLGRLLLLTGQRRGEVAGMAWSEIDLIGATWRISPERSKTRAAHILPLPEAACAILAALPRIVGCDLVLPSRSGSDRPISGFSKGLRTAQRRSGTSGWTWHDCRRTVRTGMARLGVLPHIGERVLNHAVGSDVARIYDLHRYQGEMRAALTLWSAELHRIVTGGEAQVVALRRA